MRDATIKSSVPIRVEEVDDMMMTAIGVSTPDHGEKAPDAFHASNPPPTDGPLINMVSHPPPVPLRRWIITVPLFMLFIFI
jgi:hypothetical protein